METNIKVSGIVHDVLINLNRFTETFLLDQG
jgi:hypothetical protein